MKRIPSRSCEGCNYCIIHYGYESGAYCSCPTYKIAPCDRLEIIAQEILKELEKLNEKLSR